MFTNETHNEKIFKYIYKCLLSHQAQQHLKVKFQTLWMILHNAEAVSVL